MHIAVKPYMETEEEAAHWSGPNTMGTVSYVSQLMVLAIGLLSLILEDSLDDTTEVLLALVAIVALVVPLGLTGMAIAMNKTTYVSQATNVVSNVLHQERGFETE